MYNIHASNSHWVCTIVLGSLCNQALNPVVDPVWGPPTLMTTSNVALELNSVNGASRVTLVQLPGISYLTALSLPLTLIDLKIFLKTHLFHLAFWHF